MNLMLVMKKGIAVKVVGKSKCLLDSPACFTELFCFFHSIHHHTVRETGMAVMNLMVAVQANLVDQKVETLDRVVM